ncbi:MAG: 1,4-alpha-glucan branching enzyme [Desulforhopalus sp.]|jgi:1,4-alpha-glucan branching enzyme
MSHSEKILNCCHHDPFQYLGAHFSDIDEPMVTLRTFQPNAERVFFVTDGTHLEMERIHADGIFVLTIPTKGLPDPHLDPFNYQYEIQYANGVNRKINDTYRFEVQLGDQDRFLFNKGTNYQIYNHLGAHKIAINNINGIIFRLWSPNAQAISIIGNFNYWDKRVHQMRSLGASGIWELFIPHLDEGEIYKYAICGKYGRYREKADPFQFFGELRPQTGSIVRSLAGFDWKDTQWNQNRKESPVHNRPLSIYEVHPGSWQRDPDDSQRFLTYIELADKLIPYVLKMGFTHIELMAVMEHPLDESWGYQVTAPFSITSRYGTPEEFMEFVDRCHNNNIGVILDWVPAHFPKDDHSLGFFDGTPLYEHEDHRLGSHPEWGTYIYNYGRNEVSNYLIANAMFWFDQYHIDGLRVDAVASMLYLDYARNEGEWVPNSYGGRENLEAIEFIRHLNSMIAANYPDRLMIAEESTSFYGVSKPAEEGGLGFNYKWNMGWMNDILDYFEKDPIYRKYHHNKLTFSIVYAFSENFILPLSHDEMVHGKNSLLRKMPGDDWQKFANLRLLLSLMWLHPGKKLLFMGSEFGQWSEWYCKQSLDWHLLESPLHAQLLHCVATLNKLYTDNPSLWELDNSSHGFSWLDIEDRDNSIISFSRHGNDRNDHLVCVFNFTPQPHPNYKVALPTLCNYEIIFDSDSINFGGATAETPVTVIAIDELYAQGICHTRVDLPPLGALILKPVTP